MPTAPALVRLVAPMIAAGVLLSGCGQPSSPADAGASTGAMSGQEAHGNTAGAAGAAGEPLAAAGPQFVTGPAPDLLPNGALYRNPANGRDEVIVEGIRDTAVLIGDSQSSPGTAWTRQGLARAGYGVFFCGLGGTGFVAANGKTGNYIDALQRGDWNLPYGSPPLVVIQGGGNDAGRGATDAQISKNADRLIAALRQRYPDSKFLMIGTLARGAKAGGGRRSEVDALLGTVAARHDIAFISVGDWLTRYDAAKLMADGRHMTDAGNDALGAVLGRRLHAMGIQADATRGS